MRTLFEDSSPPRWARLFAGLLLGGVTVAVALAALRSSRQSSNESGGEPQSGELAQPPSPADTPAPEPNWTSGEVALKVDGIEIFEQDFIASDFTPAEVGRMVRDHGLEITLFQPFRDFERLPEVKERAQRYSGLKKYFILRMPQRPGALREFLMMLGAEDDIARFEYLKKSARNFGSVLIGIETKSADNFAQLYGRMDAAGFTYRDITGDESLAEFLI